MPTGSEVKVLLHPFYQARTGTVTEWTGGQDCSGHPKVRFEGNTGDFGGGGFDDVDEVEFENEELLSNAFGKLKFWPVDSVPQSN